MATDATKVITGAGTFSIGAYVTAGGAGSLVDVGYSNAPFELTPEFENTEIESENQQGVIKSVPTKTGYTLKVPILESDPEHLRIALGQPAANLTGTAPDETLRVGDRTEQYHQGTLATSGIGTTGARTFTFWKLQILSMDPIQIGKAVAQMYNAVFRVMPDTSVTTLDKFFKQVDA